MSERPLIIAHRGASGFAPENTCQSFLLAFVQGADAVEADLRISSDGQLVVIHDENTKRVSGVTLRVEKTPFEKLRALEVGRVGSTRLKGYRMPTLEQVLEILPPTKSLLLDIKGGEKMVPALVEILSRAEHAKKNVQIMSEDVGVLMALAEKLPRLARVLKSERRWSRKLDRWLPEPEILAVAAKSAGAVAVALDSRSLAGEPGLVSELGERGLKIHVWTVNRGAGAARFARMGVSGIHTAYPAQLLDAFAGGLAGKAHGRAETAAA